MNYMEQVAHLLGVELEEEFEVKGISEIKYAITSDGVRYVYKDGTYHDAMVSIEDLIKDSDKIVKIPFKPKYEEDYWCCQRNCTASTTWYGHTIDYLNWKLGNCFRTKEGAETKGKELMESIVKEYEQ